jgi:hypothetical protein
MQELFEIVARGNFDKGSVRCTYEDHEPHFPKNSHASVENAWNDFRRSHKIAFDSQLFNVLNATLKRGRIHLRLSATTYRIVVGTRRIRSRQSNIAIPNPLGVRIIAETSDGKIVLGRRPAWVEKYPLTVDTPAGYADRHKDWSMGHPDPFKAASRELEEELQIASRSIHGMICLGAMFDICHHQTLMIFRCRLSMESSSLGPKTLEFDKLHFIDSTEKIVSHFLKSRRCSISPACKGTMNLWLSLQEHGLVK